MKDETCWNCHYTLNEDFIIFNNGHRLCKSCEEKFMRIFYHCYTKLQREGTINGVV
jgi:hypothetical protein